MIAIGLCLMQRLKQIGLRWNRRKDLTKRLGYDPQQTNEEDDAEAVQQGNVMRQRLRERINRVPDVPDHFPPPEPHAPHRRRAPSPENQAPRRYKRIRLETDSDEGENVTHGEPFEPLSSHPGSEGAAGHSIIITSDSDDDQPPPPARSRPIRDPRNRRRSPNPFLLDEAEEADESDDDQPAHRRTSDSVSDSLADSLSSSDSDSDSDDSFIIVDDYFE